MSKINIVIATHGQFGKEMIVSAEMIAGKLDRVHHISLMPEMSFEDFASQADALLSTFTEPTVVLVDLFGGTPCNVMTALSKKYHHQVIAGINLPALLEITFNNNEDASENINQLTESCLNAIRESAVNPVEKLSETI